MKITPVIRQVLRIKRVEQKTASSQDAVIVRIRTDTGLEGIGEADSSPEVVKAIIDAPYSHNVACGLRRKTEPARGRVVTGCTDEFLGEGLIFSCRARLICG